MKFICDVRCIFLANMLQKMIFFILFDCLFGDFSTTREFLTHLETSQLPVKGCKFLPLLGTYGY